MAALEAGADAARKHSIRFGGELRPIAAWEGDRWGNLTYRGSGQNFNPVMATAARKVVAEVDEVVETGALDPEQIVTPHPYVDHLVLAKERL